jgi:hypothetical protein
MATDLNKCCPKHDFPLTRIDKIIDSTVGCEMMALMNCFLRYHQIWLRREDEEKTSFITRSKHIVTSECSNAYAMQG